MKDKKFNNEIVGRELLANCYAAMQPQPAWFQTFREAIEKVVGNLETYAQDANNSLILRAARRIAKDESFGSVAIMKTLPIAEIIQHSDRDAQRKIEQIREEERKKANDRTSLLLAGQRREIHEGQARTLAAIGRWVCVIATFVIFVSFTALYDQAELFSARNYLLVVLQLLFLMPAAVGILDLVGISLVKPLVASLENGIFRVAFKLLHGKPYVEGPRTVSVGSDAVAAASQFP